MSNDLGPYGAFMKHLFEETRASGANVPTLIILPFGEDGRDAMYVGPHPGFERSSFVMSLSTDGEYKHQFAFSSDDVRQAKQFMESLAGWIAFTEACAEEVTDGGG